MTNNVNVDDLVKAMFGEQKTFTGVKKRVKGDFDKRSKKIYFTLIEEQEGGNIEKELDGTVLSGVCVGFLQKWQTQYDFIKTENVFSKWMTSSNKGGIDLYQKDAEGKEVVFKSFPDEKSLFDALANKSALEGEDVKLGHLNRINVLFLYVPTLNEVVKLYVPYLTMKNSEISELIKNGKSLLSNTMEVGMKSIKNKKGEESLVYTFKLVGEHSVSEDVIKEGMANVLTYLR